MTRRLALPPYYLVQRMHAIAPSNAEDISIQPRASGTESVQSGPIASRSRIEDIDVIRGAALFGVLIMNLVECFRVPYTFRFPVAAEPGGFEGVVNAILSVVLAGKAMTLFSILFGVGMAIFLERASARGPGAMALLVRRLLILLAIGTAHMLLLWQGDILFSYAVSGLLSLLLIRRRQSTLLIVAVALLAFRPLLFWVWPTVLPSFGPAIVRHYQDAIATYGTGTYLQIVAFRASEEWSIGIPVAFVRALPAEVSNILIGICLWRSGVLHHVERHRRTLIWVARLGLILGGGYAVYHGVLRALGHVPAPGQLLFAVESILLRMFALGYGALILLLLHRPRGRAVLLRLAPLGQMAFTNYLTQTIVFTTLFYGYGLGLLGKVGITMALLLGVSFYFVQGVASTIWLRRFRFGPFEWAWRSLTYGKLQPMRR